MATDREMANVLTEVLLKAMEQETAQEWAARLLEEGGKEERC